VPTSVVKPEQLCAGLHIHLDLPWTDHPFSFPSFTIASADEIAAIRGLGLKEIRYSPAKSSCLPLACDGPGSPPVDVTPPSSDAETIADGLPYQLKKARIERLAAQQAAIAAGEREFIAIARQIKTVRQNLFSQPEHICELAGEAVAKLAESTLVDAERSIRLFSDKVGGESIFNHALNVALLSMLVGREMQLSADEVKLLGLGGLFHDLGQAEIPDVVKNKTEPWTPSEAAMMRKHCAWGVALGKKLGLPDAVLLIIAQHHEGVDGSGYPRKLRGERLSPLARIVALSEAYDQLCNPKNPAAACTPHEALAFIYAQKRAQFDTAVLTAFVRCMTVYPPGSLVRLSNGTLGLVIAVNSARPLAPTVLVYDSAVATSCAILVDLAAEPEVTISKALRAQELSIAASQVFLTNKLLS